jgi:integrase
MPRKTNFTTNGHDYFRVTATVGKNPDGSPVRKQFYGDSKKAAEEKRDEYLAGIRQGLSVDYQKNTFGVTFKHWLEHVQRHKIGLSSFVKYESLYRSHISACGLVGMRLIDIKSANIQSYYNDLLGVSGCHIVHAVHRLLNVFFKYCLKSDILIKNPLLAVELPKLPKQSDRNTAISDSDIEKLVDAANNNIKYFPFVFACFTGLRGGELLALTYKDIDFKDGTINVNKSVNRLKVDGERKTIVSETKTAASIRRIPIFDEITPLLKAHINHITQEGRIISLTGDFLLFPSATGTYRGLNDFRISFQRLCDKLEIKKGRTIHSLRHTFCTILARQGVSLLDASRLMGHSNVNITAKIYSHVTDEDKKNAVKKLSVYFR